MLPDGTEIGPENIYICYIMVFGIILLTSGDTKLRPKPGAESPTPTGTHFRSGGFLLGPN